jgi:hypothetical protein
MPGVTERWPPFIARSSGYRAMESESESCWRPEKTELSQGYRWR